MWKHILVVGQISDSCKHILIFGQILKYINIFWYLAGTQNTLYEYQIASKKIQVTNHPPDILMYDIWYPNISNPRFFFRQKYQRLTSCPVGCSGGIRLWKSEARYKYPPGERHCGQQMLNKTSPLTIFFKRKNQ